MIHTFLSTSAACLLPVILNSVQAYFMVITSYNWWRFFLVTVISLVLNQTWIAVYMMVTYATPSNACHAGLVIAILAGFSGGFIVTRGEMPFGWVSVLNNAYKLLSVTWPAAMQTYWSRTGCLQKLIFRCLYDAFHLYQLYWDENRYLFPCLFVTVCLLISFFLWRFR